MKPAISARNICKEFRLGELSGADTLREAVAGWFQRKTSRNVLHEAEEGYLRALDDVSFDVAPGEVLGIIGHNGAGKSTLLKILSRITEPTSGEIEIRGRVSSLLEVGTGFHPELTGRENIMLNGSILGMKRAEIIAKFDEIVDFSGVERFLDTPVKRYSTGMQVRLAFAVAAHLEPEILIIDEVLAVGDAEFQRRCLGKMDDVARSGRTVLFVSHNMAAVENLCTSCVMLERGRLRARGHTRDIISAYLSESRDVVGDVDLTKRQAHGQGVLRRFRILDPDGSTTPAIPLGGSAVFEISGRTGKQLKAVTMNIRIDSSMGQRVAVFHTLYQYPDSIVLKDDFTLRCTMDNCRLMPGIYHLRLILKDMEMVVDETEPISFEVSAADVYKTGKVLPARTGSYVPEAKWAVAGSI